MTTGPTLAAVLDRLRWDGVRSIIGSTSVPVAGITHDSRRVGTGSIFLCIRGTRADGHDFAPAAVAAGGSVLVVDHLLDDLAATQLVVDDVRLAAGYLAAAVYGHPSQRMQVVGVTGTNGKTTATHMLAAILEAAGTPTRLIGTLSGTHTTPEAPDLQAALSTMAAEGAEAVAMEVSSHALALHRVDGSRFAAAVFTNLTRDHLDLHGTQEAYFAAKARLFTPEFTDLAVVNRDDAHGRRLAGNALVRTVGYARAQISDVEVGPTVHRYRWRGTNIHVPLGGDFNVENSLAAATTAAELGIDSATIAAGLAALAPVSGRFQPVPNDRGLSIIVDYAHTPDGLRRALQSARAAVGTAADPDGAAPARVIVVFGCGGDRDQAKRPEMGAIAAELADHVVVTSDNPRSEDPRVIMASIIEGVPAGYRDRVTVHDDRRAAIGLALGMARAGDLVLVAGKGHETTQTIGTSVLPFDDRAVVREFLEHPK